MTGVRERLDVWRGKRLWLLVVYLGLAVVLAAIVSPWNPYVGIAMMLVMVMGLSLLTSYWVARDRAAHRDVG